ncbi:uncharacterized protein EV154DRAFT_547796 [Mucor mucedo]|uniref:uncharacterized protein n=1 Tax=Mucor mucedo TaxID=29922 RepID=UPI00221FA9BA|nr:uncharacterized protein EV154DRAFT_547796 [Mucor mucedo]KAI7896140.1 hypothetical protein EV154DRAFT_547796 [Mucor mucedo]
MKIFSLPVVGINYARKKKWQHVHQQTLQDEVVGNAAVEEDSRETKKKTAEIFFENLSRIWQGIMAKMESWTWATSNFQDDSPKPLVTLEERDILVELSNCKKTAELENLLSAWYSRKELSSNCKYIRFALSASLELWSTKSLLNKTHGEDWYRMHVYSNVWDKAFLDDEPGFADVLQCYSTQTKAYVNHFNAWFPLGIWGKNETQCWLMFRCQVDTPYGNSYRNSVDISGAPSFVYFTSIIAGMKDACTTFFLVTIATISSIFETLSCPCEKNMIRNASTVVILGEFETKRSECVSQVTKVLKEAKKDIKLQRLDFILRDMNNDTDILTVEEKPSLKGVKADIKKGNMLKRHALYLWSKQVDSSALMERLEAISCQWQGTKFTIYGSRLLSSDTMLIYRKGCYSFPISSRHSPEFSKLLLAILSLKRTVKLNYAKFNLILEKKYKNEVKTLNFADDHSSEISITSDSTNSDIESEDSNYKPEDKDFVENTKVMLDELKEEEKGLKRFHDWEDMLLYDCSKLLRIS